MNFSEKIADLQRRVQALQLDENLRKQRKLPSECYFLNQDEIVCYPRAFGDSRYPYSVDGLNLWAHASGNVRVEESTFNVFADTADGKEPRLCFYAAEKRGNGYFPISLTGAGKWAFEENVTRYTVFTPAAVYYFTQTQSFTACVRMFLDKEKNLRFSVYLCGEKDVDDTYISAYFDPILSTSALENIETKWFRSSALQEDGFVLRNTRAIKRMTYLRHYVKITRERVENVYSTTARSVYKGGTNNQITCATALINGKFDRDVSYTEFTDMAVAGDIIPLSLQKGKTFTVSYTLSLADDKQPVTPAVTDTDGIDNILYNEGQNDCMPTLSFSDIKTDSCQEYAFNAFIKNVIRQVEFCARAKNYAGAYIGIRDIFQQLEAAIMWIPDYCRKKIVEALGFIGEDGRAPRQYSYPSSKQALPEMDLRPFIDQGVWIISTVYTYLAYTGDYGILDEICGYYRLDGYTVDFSERRDSVLEHLIAITEYLLSHLDEKTGCLHALYGDWNDALDGLGNTVDTDKEYGTGVSVMATLQLYQNLREMTEVLQKIGKYPQKRVWYEKERLRIAQGLAKYAVVENENGERKIVHGWGDKRSYLVGSFADNNGKSRDGATSNAFWVLSGAIDTDFSLKWDILQAYRRLDSKYGIKTFEPYFAEDNKGVGRIIYLPEGTAENGAVYIHATLFAAWSLFVVGEAKKAWEQILKILPITHSFISTTPFVMPNSYVYNAEKGMDGESMSDWFTGSGCVLVKILLWYVLGLRADLSGMVLAPATDLPFKKAKFSLTLKGTQLSVRYQNVGKGERAFVVNGQKQDVFFDEKTGVFGWKFCPEQWGKHVTVEIEE